MLGLEGRTFGSLTFEQVKKELEKVKNDKPTYEIPDKYRKNILTGALHTIKKNTYTQNKVKISITKTKFL